MNFNSASVLIGLVCNHHAVFIWFPISRGLAKL
jgi:hypothetical protein